MIQFPPIEPLASQTHRPFWSVMIPTYNGTEYLEQTLRSVLDQDPGPDHMQIEVVDDCSTQDDPESLVNEIGKGRVTFFRNPQNRGLIDNWNTCIQRSRGYWVHLLHQDDFVRPGFYKSLENGLKNRPDIGAGFCRHQYINEHNEILFPSVLELEAPGILADWLNLIGVMQRIQFASIVVRRSTYETLGGFYSGAGSAADLEMWRRIAAKYPVWYEPEILACFRLHSDSTSSGLIRTGKNIADTRLASKISKSYLPKEIGLNLANASNKYYAVDAIKRAEKLIEKGDLKAAAYQIVEAYKCNCSFRILRSTAGLLKRSSKDILIALWLNLDNTRKASKSRL